MLISIADAASPEWGKAARAAALVLSAEKDEDLPVRLLYDIRDVFDRQPLDRLSTNVLLTELFDLPDARWSEPKLTDRRLASLLAPFKIKPKPLWPARRTIAAKSFRSAQ